MTPPPPWPDIVFHPGSQPVVKCCCFFLFNGHFSLPPLTLPPSVAWISVTDSWQVLLPLTLPHSNPFSPFQLQFFNGFPLPLIKESNLLKLSYKACHDMMPPHPSDILIIISFVTFFLKKPFVWLALHCSISPYSRFQAHASGLPFVWGTLLTNSLHSLIPFHLSGLRFKCHFLRKLRLTF